VPRMPSAAFSQIVNRSMSEVIVRSLATSFCTMLPVLALFFFGGETLKDFAFALLIGTLSGTYSSVFIAGPVLVHWKEKERVYATRFRRIREQLGYVPAYAVATPGGAPVDVEPTKKRREAVSLTAPQDPTQVSRQDFDDMVANLGIDEEAPRSSQPAAAAAGRPAGGRRARSRAAQGKGGGTAPRPPADGGGSQPPAQGGDGSSDKPKKPRNRRHGRPR
jgi:SecD/SecF fusion protein